MRTSPRPASADGLPAGRRWVAGRGQPTRGLPSSMRLALALRAPTSRSGRTHQPRSAPESGARRDRIPASHADVPEATPQSWLTSTHVEFRRCRASGRELPGLGGPHLGLQPARSCPIKISTTAALIVFPAGCQRATLGAAPAGQSRDHVLSSSSCRWHRSPARQHKGPVLAIARR